MNNISGYIQPTMYAPQGVMGVMPQMIPQIMQQPAPQIIPIVTNGGRSDITMIIVVSVIIIMVIFMMYNQMEYSEDYELEKGKKTESFENNDSVCELIDGDYQCDKCHRNCKRYCKYCHRCLNCILNDTNHNVTNIVDVEDIDLLSNCGWELYISLTCPYCIKQKHILDQYFPKFNKIFTDKPVSVVPTWYNTITNQTIPGMQTYESLIQMTKC